MGGPVFSTGDEQLTFGQIQTLCAFCGEVRGIHIGSLANVATCSYIPLMISTGIRELKNKLSHYVRQIEAGKRVAVTAHGRVVAELVPPGAGTGGASPYEELVAAGIIVPATQDDEGPPEWPDIRLSSGTVAELIDSDRGEP
jgi:prevent-host-death family protein